MEADPTLLNADDRHRSAWTLREKVGRLAWAAAEQTLFRLSFHSWDRWRCWLLRRFGARIGPGCVVRRTVRIEVPWNLTLGKHVGIGDGARLYSLGPIRIGDYATVSQYAHLCAGSHDHSRVDLPLLRTPITIGTQAWVAADAFVGPGVVVGEGALLGARGCAFSDLRPWTIYGGNPATPLKNRVMKNNPILLNSKA